MPDTAEMLEETNYESFRECLSSFIIQALEDKPDRVRTRRASRKKRLAEVGQDDQSTSTNVGVQLTSRDDADVLAEFLEYIASEIFTSFPADLRTLSFSGVQRDDSLASTYSDPLPASTFQSLLTGVPASVEDTLVSYSILPPDKSLAELLSTALIQYISSCVASPPPPSSTRTTACEICAREYIPLTYHHLIPKAVHAKALKRGWHEEWELNHVAWLCRACHSFVHRMASNEELAKEWYTVEMILTREDVIDWAQWVGRVRWKAR